MTDACLKGEETGDPFTAEWLTSVLSHLKGVDIFLASWGVEAPISLSDLLPQVGLSGEAGRGCSPGQVGPDPTPSQAAAAPLSPGACVRLWMKTSIFTCYTSVLTFLRHRAACAKLYNL